MMHGQKNINKKKLRGSLQLFIENASCNSNPVTGALYKIGRYHITCQTDEDELEGF